MFSDSHRFCVPLQPCDSEGTEDWPIRRVLWSCLLSYRGDTPSPTLLPRSAECLPPRQGPVWVRQRVLPLLVDSLLHSPLAYILQEFRFPDAPSGPKFKHNRALGAREAIQMHIRMTLLDCQLDRVWVTVGVRVSWWRRLSVGGAVLESMVKKGNIAASIWVHHTPHPDYGCSVWSTVS